MNGPIAWLEDQFNETYEWLHLLSRKSYGEKIIPTCYGGTTYMKLFRPIQHVDWIGPSSLFEIKEDA